MSNRKFTYTLFGLLISLSLVSGALMYTNISNFALVPNVKGEYPSKISLLMQKVGLVKAEAILAPKDCMAGCYWTGSSCACDAYDGGGCTAQNALCGSDPNTCNIGTPSGYVNGATSYSWQCDDMCGGPTDLCAIPKTVNAACSSTHYNCAAGTEYPAYRYSGPDGWSWRCLGSGGGSNIDCHEGGPTINSLTLTNPIDYWGYTYLSYSSTGASSCTLRLDGGTWTAAGTSNSNVSYGHNIADNTFTLTCTAPNGINSYQTVRLNTRPRVSISADSSSKQYGQSATITWSLTHENAATCNVTKNGAAWQTTTNTSPSSPSYPDQATVKSASDPIYGNTTYNVTCTTQYGSTNSASVTVNLAATNGACGGSTYSCSTGGSVNNSSNSTSFTWQCTGYAGGSTVSCSSPKASCSLPWGGSIASGSSVTAYASASVSCGSTPVSQTRTCDNGSLSGSYTLSSAPAASTRTMYAAQTSACGTYGSVSQTQTCQSNGAWTGSYTLSSAPSASARTGYTASTVSCGSSCTAQTQYCQSSGAWGGSGIGSCSVTPVNGSCGGSINACSSGSLSDTADDSVNYNWQCTGSCSGSTASCTSPKPPVVSVTANSANGGTSGRAYSGEAATLTWTASNSPTGCTIYRNGSSLATVAGSATSYTTPGLSDGNTTFRVDCSNAGGTGTGNTVTYVVPTVPTGLSASCGSPGSTANFSWTLPSGFTGSYFRYCKGASCDYNIACNPAKTPPEGSCVNGTYSSISQTATPNSTYSWYIHTMDVSGNWSSAVSGSNVYCTPAAPNAPSIGNPTPATVGVGMNASFVISGTDSVGMNVRYAIDADNNGTVDQTTSYSTSGWSYTWSNNWAGAGSKTFQVRTESTDGRVSGWTSKTINIIATPTATISADTTVVQYGDPANITWGSSNSTSCSVTKNGAAWQSGLSGSAISSGSLTADAVFVNTCTNSVGQTSTANITIRVCAKFNGVVTPDTATLKCGQTPTISWTSNYASNCTVTRSGTTIGTGSSNAGVSFGVPISDYFFSVDYSCVSVTGYTCTGSFGGGNFAMNGACGVTNNTCNSGTLADVADSASQYLWNCNGGCTGSSASCSQNKPPIAPTITGPANGAASTDYNFVISGTDPASQQVKYAIDWNNDGTVDGTTALGASGWNYTWTNNWAGGGPKYFKAKTISADGRESGWSTVFTVNIHDLPVVNISTPTQTVLYNAESSPINWTSTDATSCSVTKGGVAWQTGLSGSAVASGNLTSDTTFVLTCTNIKGSNSASVTVYVEPTVTLGLNPATVAYNGISTITWSTNYAGSCSVTKGGVAWQTGVSSAGISSGALTSNTLFKIDCTSTTGKATNSTQGTVTVNPLNGACSAAHYTCTAGTSANNVSGAMKWTWNCNGANGGTNATCEQVKPAPNAPTITGPTQGKINTPYNFNITATNPSGDPIRYAIDWDNSGTVDGYLPISGTTTSGTSLTWTNQWAGNGVKTFKVRTETNGGPISAWTTYNITLFGAPDVVWTPASANLAYGNRLTFGYSSTDSTYCNLYSTVVGDPNTYEATPFWSNAPVSNTWTNEGPYYQDFKRKAVCYNPFGDYKSVEFTVSVTQNDATCDSVTIPNYLTPGEKFSPKVYLNNTGSNTWGNVSPFLHNVFVGQTVWGTNRYLPLVVAPVAPGAKGTFYGPLDALTAPSTEGYYDFSARGVQGLEAGGESFYGATCTPVTIHAGNKILVKAPTLGVGDGDVDIDALAFPMSYVVNDPAIVKTVTVRNRGGGTITGSISIPAGKFACVDGCNFALGPGGTSTVSVSFASNATGTFATTMAVNSNAGNKNVTLTAGTGAKFEIKYSPLDFGQVPTGKTKYLDLKITNNSLVQNSGAFGISPTAPFYCAIGCTSADLGPNTTRTIRLKFSPTEVNASSVSQDLVLPTNPGVTITLKAQGIKPVFKIEEK